MHRRPKLIEFVTPTQAQALQSAPVKVELELRSGAKKGSLEVNLNGKKITGLFDAGDACSAGRCDLSASVNQKSGLRSGWNALSASVALKSGAVGVAHSSFYLKPQGLGDTTDGLALPYELGLIVTNNETVELVENGETKVLMAPNQQWSPCSTYYGNNSLLTALVMDRHTLTVTKTMCMKNNSADPTDDFLTLTTDQMVVVTSPNSLAVTGVDFSLIGGSDLRVPGRPYLPPPPQPIVYGYTAVGFGQAGRFSAYESFGQETANSFGNYGPLFYGIDGVLENVDSSGSQQTYIFRPADMPGFTLRPNTSGGSPGYTLQIGYNKVSLPDGTTPAGQDYTYSGSSSSACPDCDFWLAIFDRNNLNYLAQEGYHASNPDEQNNFAQQIQNLPVNSLVFIAFYGGASSTPITPALARAIQRLGASPHDLNSAMQAGKYFAMVGVNDGEPVANKQYATPIDTQADESGILHGLLTRNHQMMYVPSQVAPVTNANSSLDPTMNDLIYQLGVTRPVAFPMTDTNGRQAAYKWLSTQIALNTVERGNGCGDVPQCDDIRYFYTGELSENLTNAATNYAYQANSGFTAQDLTDVEGQLNKELGYLANINKFKDWQEVAFSDANSNIAIKLQAAGQGVASALNAGVPTAQQRNISGQNVQLASDVLNTTAGVTSLVGVAFPPLAAVSGALWIAAGVLQTVHDTGVSEPTKDPDIVTLGNLIAETDSESATVSEQYAAALEDSLAKFYDGVFSNWHKMETIGQLASVPGSGYYIQDLGYDATSYNDQILVKGATYSLYKQLLPNFFTIDDYPGLAVVNNDPNKFMKYNNSITNLLDFCYDPYGLRNSTYNSDSMPDYSISYPPGIYSDPSWRALFGFNQPLSYASYQISHPGGMTLSDWKDMSVIRANQNANVKAGFWTSSLGDAIMGSTPDSLNINHIWFFDSAFLPHKSLTCPSTSPGVSSDNTPVDAP